MTLAALGAGALVLLVLGLRDRRRPGPVPSPTEHLATWEGTHGLEPRGLARGWVVLAYRLGRPLARRGVGPDVVTLSALWWAGLTLVLADRGGRWALAALASLLVTGLVDGLDGAVASLTRRVTPFGAVLDAVVDRVVDVVLLLVLLDLGAPGPACAGAGALLGLLEYTRARAQGAGMAGPGLVTPGERPVRVALAGGVLLTAGWRPQHAAAAAQVGVAVQIVLTGIGLVLLVVAVGRVLRRR